MIRPDTAGSYDIDNLPADFTYYFAPESVVDDCFSQQITPKSFRDVGLTAPYTKNIIGQVRESGAYSYADLAVLGFKQVASEAQLKTRRQDCLRIAFQRVTGQPMSDEALPPDVWHNYYDDLRNASPVILASNYTARKCKYTLFDAPWGWCPQVIGSLIHMYQDGGSVTDWDILGVAGLERNKALNSFVMKLALPTVLEFDQQVRYPRLRAARDNVSQEIAAIMHDEPEEL